MMDGVLRWGGWGGTEDDHQHIAQVTEATALYVLRPGNNGVCPACMHIKTFMDYARKQGFQMVDTAYVEHFAQVVPAKKMDLHGPAWKGACSCGWRSKGSPTTSHNALKAATEHANAKNAAAAKLRAERRV